jgi:hypothetical protein
VAVIVSCHALVLSGSAALGQVQDDEGSLPRIDAREVYLDAKVPDAGLFATQEGLVEDLARRYEGLVVRWNDFSDTPASVYRTTGVLTPPSNLLPQNVVKRFLLEQPELYRLTPGDADSLVLVRLHESSSPPDAEGLQNHGLVDVTFDQYWMGRQVLTATQSATLTSAGELVQVSGELVPDLAGSVNVDEPILSSENALEIAAAAVEAPKSQAHRVTSGPDGPDQRQVFESGDDFNHEVYVRLVYYPVAPKTVTLGWEVILGRSSQPYHYQTVVDATTGDLLLLQSLTEEIASSDVPTWLVFAEALTAVPSNTRSDMTLMPSPQPMWPGPSSPDGSQGKLVSQQRIQTNGDLTASRGGWLAADTMTTTGNNAEVFVDGEQPTASLVTLDGVQTRAFEFAFDAAEAPEKESNRFAAATNAFFVVNWFHDRLYHLGFDEAAGNFQERNYSGNGRGGDPVHVVVHAGHDNARFSTLPDGKPGILRAYTFTGPSPDRDAAVDQTVLIHELTHGLVQRIIGGPGNRGLNKSGQPLGLGEGYADVYTLLLLSKPTDPPDATYAVGGYVAHKFKRNPEDWTDNEYFGIRHFPYSTDICVSPLTFEDINAEQYDPKPPTRASCGSTSCPISPWLENGAGKNHDIGEIWAAMLWEVRANLVERLGVEEGNELALWLITQSLFELGKPDPNLIDARDALIRREQLLTGGRYYCDLITGFAKRGISTDAVVEASGRVTEDFTVPAECSG